MLLSLDYDPAHDPYTDYRESDGAFVLYNYGYNKETGEWYNLVIKDDKPFTPEEGATFYSNSATLVQPIQELYHKMVVAAQEAETVKRGYEFFPEQYLQFEFHPKDAEVAGKSALSGPAKEGAYVAVKAPNFQNQKKFELIEILHDEGAVTFSAANGASPITLQQALDQLIRLIREKAAASYRERSAEEAKKKDQGDSDESTPSSTAATPKHSSAPPSDSDSEPDLLGSSSSSSAAPQPPPPPQDNAGASSSSSSGGAGDLNVIKGALPNAGLQPLFVDDDT